MAVRISLAIYLLLVLRVTQWPRLADPGDLDRLAVPLGAAFSTAIELSQLAFFPERVPTPQDVVMNTLGAAAGVVALATAQRRSVARVGTMEHERRPSLLSPSRLQPLELDLRRVFWLGIALWAVALVVATALAATSLVSWRAVAICATGLVLGFLAVVWERRHQARSHRLLGQP